MLGKAVTPRPLPLRSVNTLKDTLLEEWNIIRQTVVNKFIANMITYYDTCVHIPKSSPLGCHSILVVFKHRNWTCTCGDSIWSSVTSSWWVLQQSFSKTVWKLLSLYKENQPFPLCTNNRLHIKTIHIQNDRGIP